MEGGEEDETSKMEPRSNSPLPEPGTSTVMNAESVSGSQCELQTEPLKGGDSGDSLSRDEEEHHKPAVGDVGVRGEEEGGEKVGEERGTVGGEVIWEGKTEVEPVVAAEIATKSQKASDLIVSEAEMPPRGGGNGVGCVIREKKEQAVVVTEPKSPMEKRVQLLDAVIDVIEKEGEKGVNANMAPSVGNTMGEDVEEADMAVEEDVRLSECDGGDTVVEEVKEAELEETTKAKASHVAEDVRHSECDGGDTVVEEVKEAETEGTQKAKEGGSEVPDWVARGVKDMDDRMVGEEMKGGVEDKATESLGISSGIENDAEVAENAARDVAVDGSSEVKKEKEIQEESCEDTTAGTVVEDTMDTDAKEYREVGDVEDDSEVMEERGIPEELTVGEDTDVVEEMEIAEDIDVGDEEKMDEGSKSGGTKRRRARISKVVKKKIEEDVCFICFDGGELVLCDRRFILLH